jgi:NADH:ubiquinone oxidoreductase subunit K
MEENREKIIKEIEELGRRSAMLREAFERRAALYSTLSRILIISSTVLSLLAAGSIASSLTKLLDPKVMQILAVCAATASAITSGVGAEFFSNKKIRKLFSISTQYLEIREAAKRAILKPGLTDQALYSRLDNLQKVYIHLSQSSGEDEISYPKKHHYYGQHDAVRQHKHRLAALKHQDKDDD